MFLKIYTVCNFDNSNRKRALEMHGYYYEQRNRENGQLPMSFAAVFKFWVYVTLIV